ncbi:hypothetical protein [Hymenobacter sp. DG01]|uniref:hypothetical protein n=1 Tax=Hymenobacter sp. DG01 TaxID=2584940 RepID=UPI0011232040|nr:hypothetical protein [Hymenobacter sp. DG01]
MNPTRYIHSTVLLSLLALGACKKEEAPKAVLPEATQTGQNTAGAKVDGTVWLPVQQFLYAGAPLTARYTKSVTGYELDLYFGRFPAEENDPFSETSINFYVPDIRKPGTIQLNQQADPKFTTANPAYATFTYGKPSPDQVLITGPAAPGTLTITRLDTVARVVAGTYEFRAQALTGTGSVNVTEGRFDLKY